MTTQYSDVVVVGAGPAGLVLTETLARAGLSVIVVERQDDPARSPQGALLQPLTLDLLARLVGFEHFLADPGAVVGIEEFGPHGLLFSGRFSQVPGTPTDYAVNVSQGDLRAILLDHVRPLPNVTVRTGTDVARLDDIRAGHCRTIVTDTAGEGGPDVVHSSWIVAADGKASTVRNLAGLDATLVNFPHRLLLLSTPTPSNYTPLIRAHRREQGMVTTVPGGTPGRTLLFVHRSGNDVDGTTLVDETVEILCSADPILANESAETLLKQPIIDIHPQLVRTPAWRKDGVILLGDSAHGMHNIGGQGINTAVQDAVAIGAILSRETRSIGDRLDDFERFRRPYIEALQNAQSELGSAFWSGSSVSWFAPRFAELSMGQHKLGQLLIDTFHSGGRIALA